MKSRRNSVTAALLLVLLACGSLLVLSHPRALLSDLRTAYAVYREENGRFDALVAGTQSAVRSAVSRHTGLITVYGGFQRLIGSQIVQDANQNSNIVRLTNGQLNFIARDAEPGDPTENAARVNDFPA